MTSFNFEKIKKDFPILERKIGSNNLVYLDNAATAQKPKQVISALVDYYQNHNANVHRGIHTLSEEATNLYEEARETTANFIGARTSQEIIFTRNASESLNFVAATFGDAFVGEGDIILTGHFEHHSNLVPWQQLVKRKGAKLDFINMTDTGELDFDDLKQKLNEKVKIIAITHASNVLGTIVDIKQVCKLAHAVGAKVVVDGAQAIPHLAVNVQSLDCDAYAFSGHKMLGPTGIGVLYVKKDLLNQIEPYQFGGGMIENVDLHDSTWADIPERFEAGTPNVAGAIGLAAAIRYLQSVGMENITTHEQKVSEYAIKKLSSIEGLTIYGPKDPKKRTGLVSFTLDKLHPHDISSVLNSVGVAVRAGHHCAHPLHKKLQINATVRASYYLYNDNLDVDLLYKGLLKAKEILGGHK